MNITLDSFDTFMLGIIVGCALMVFASLFRGSETE